jgi:hypothetical protein
MEHSLSWEANSHSVGQGIPSLLWNSKVNYRVHKSPLLVPVLSQMNPVHNLPPCFPKTHYNILPSTSRSSEWSLPFRFSNWNIVCISHLFHACYMSRHLILLDIITLIFSEVYKLWSLSLCSLLKSTATSSLLGPNILLSTLWIILKVLLNKQGVYWIHLAQDRVL